MTSVEQDPQPSKEQGDPSTSKLKPQEPPKEEQAGPKPTRGELAYLAGYMDADGCIRSDKGHPQITVTSCFPGILKVYQQWFGGSIYSAKPRNPKARPGWRWQATGDTGMQVVQALLPYLLEKRPQAEILIRMRGMGPGVAREALASQLKAIKQVNYPKEG